MCKCLHVGAEAAQVKKLEPVPPSSQMPFDELGHESSETMTLVCSRNPQLRQWVEYSQSVGWKLPCESGSGAACGMRTGGLVVGTMLCRVFKMRVAPCHRLCTGRRPR